MEIYRGIKMTIKLNTIEDVYNFASICTKYMSSNIDVIQDRQVINGTSILGIFSLDLLRTLKVIIGDKDDNKKIGFYNNIQKWRVD